MRTGGHYGWTSAAHYTTRSAVRAFDEVTPRVGSCHVCAYCDDVTRVALFHSPYWAVCEDNGVFLGILEDKFASGVEPHPFAIAVL